MTKVLLVEDDLITRKLLERIIRKRGHEVVSVESAEDAMECLEREFFPLILLDVQLPGMSGVDLCQRIREMSIGDRCFILVGTSYSEPEELKMILDAGADDYIAKPYNPHLLNVRLTIAEQQIIHLGSRKRMEDELKFIALHDPLTGLNNRSVLTQEVTATIQSVKKGANAAVMYLDLDNFKIVNDTMGHKVGDRLLVNVARLLENNARLDDVLVRFGGDEFIIILNNATEADALSVANRFLQALETQAFNENGRYFQTNASCGIAIVHRDSTVEQLIGDADAACYAAKRQGRNRASVYNRNSWDAKRMIEDADWLSKIRNAINENSLKLWFQPIVHISTREISFYEALLRYTDFETSEVITPGAFLPSLSRFDGAIQLDYYVIRHAIAYLAAHPGITLSVNIGGSSFSDKKLPRYIFKTFREHDVEANRMIFEITETEVISNLELARGMIRQLDSFGCRFALDDFGRGFCSPNYLRNLPIHMLKLDGAFIRTLKSDAVNQILVKAILDVAQTLNIETVAEFVEDEETYSMLRDLGVNHAQGKFLGMPQADIIL